MAEENQIEEDQLQKIKDAFKIFDENESGTIDAAELGKALQVLGDNPDQSKINELIEEADKDDDNKVNEEEFITLMKKHLPSPEEVERSLREAFARFDRDGNGYVDKDELKEALTKLGQRLDNDEVEELFGVTDTNEDGKIQYEEFVKLMCC